VDGPRNGNRRFRFCSLDRGLEAKLCINGMNAPVSLLIAEVKPRKPRSGASETPGLRSAISREIIDLPSCIVPSTAISRPGSRKAGLSREVAGQRRKENPVSCALCPA
jgi:hypothetical protein